MLHFLKCASREFLEVVMPTWPSGTEDLLPELTWFCSFVEQSTCLVFVISVHMMNVHVGAYQFDRTQPLRVHMDKNFANQLSWKREYFWFLWTSERDEGDSSMDTQQKLLYANPHHPGMRCTKMAPTRRTGLWVPLGTRHTRTSSRHVTHPHHHHILKKLLYSQ